MVERSAILVLVVLLAALLAPAGLRAQTILNVERLQPDDVEGWHWGVAGSASVSEGNSETVDVEVGVAVGHRWTDGNWLRLFTGLEYLSERDEKLESDRYVHLRYNHRLAERWQTFHFVQLQARHASLLQRRFLLGSGIRRSIVDRRLTFDVGTGVMYESEDLDPDADVGDHPVEARVWRMANLAVLTYPFTESVRLIGVAYVQPDLSDFGDLRTLADLTLRIALTENLDLTIQNEWRRDSRPPEGLERDDYVLRTGFSVSFR